MKFRCRRRLCCPTLCRRNLGCRVCTSAKPGACPIFNPLWPSQEPDRDHPRQGRRHAADLLERSRRKCLAGGLSPRFGKRRRSGAKNPKGKLWVRRDGAVLRQEMMLVQFDDPVRPHVRQGSRETRQRRRPASGGLSTASRPVKEKNDRVRQRYSQLRPQGGRRPFDPDDSARRVVRALGPQRRRQDDDHQDAHRAVAADGRFGAACAGTTS